MNIPKKQVLSLQLDPRLFEKATDDEKRQADVMAKSTTFLKDGIKKLLKNPLAIMSMTILTLVVILIVAAPMVVPYKYDQIITVNNKRDKMAANLKPFEYSKLETQYMQKSGEKLFPHIMGTDELARDYFIRVVYGTRVSLLVGVFASLMVLVIGTAYGSVAGYLGGRIDLIMMRIVDIIYSLPDLLIIILLAVVFNEKLNFSQVPIFNKLGTNMVSMFIVFGLLYWVGMARLVRGQILSLKRKDFIMAADVLGVSKGDIVVRHLIPNTINVILVSISFDIPGYIFGEAFLSYLGLGVQAPNTSWGAMAASAQQVFQFYPYQLIFPALLIGLTMLAFTLLGDGLRDALDPNLRQ